MPLQRQESSRLLPLKQLPGTFYYPLQLGRTINQQRLMAKAESWFSLCGNLLQRPSGPSGPSGICHPPTLLSIKSAPNLTKSCADVIAACTQTRLLSSCLLIRFRRRQTNFSSCPDSKHFRAFRFKCCLISDFVNRLFTLFSILKRRSGGPGNASPPSVKKREQCDQR